VNQTAGLPMWSPHPDVWLLIALIGAAYWITIVRLGPTHAPSHAPAVTRLQAVSFALGLATLWIVSDWPIHDVAEQRLLSVHMAQHMVEMLVAPPLLLIGIPAWMLRLALSPKGALRTMRFLSRFLPATVLFNAALVFVHSPVAIRWQLGSGFVHFLMHVILVVASLVAWMPVLSPLPEIPRLAPALRMLFLFVQSMIPTIPASFLTFGDHPLYHVYERLPRLWGIGVLDDMQVGGLVMKMGGGIILWVSVAIIFFRWYAEEEDRAVPRRVARDIDRELETMYLPTANPG
jgi:putative membrane protein